MDKHTLKNIFKFISIVGLAVSIFLFLPILVAFIYHEQFAEMLELNIALIAINSAILVFLKNHKVKLSIHEGILSVNIIWLMLGLVTALFFVVEIHIPFIDGFFESVSGYTTTGATIFNNIEALPHSILFLRSLTHWIGGMGIIVLGVGLFSLINPNGSMALFKAESTGIKLDKVTPKIRDTALWLWLIYFGFTVADTIALKLAGMSFFDAINHAMSTISTGGFSTKNSSMGFYNSSSLILWITTIFMVLSGINFLAHLKFFTTGKISSYKKEEVLYFVGLFLLLSITLALLNNYLDHLDLYYSFTHSFFTIASIITTTGFATLDYEKWGHFAVVIVIIAMVLGGNSGSTAGGIKTIRHIVIFKNLHNQLKEMLHSNIITAIFIDKEKIGSKIVNSTNAFLLLFIITNFIIALYLYARGFDAMTSFSTAIACVGNIGPGFAKVGPVYNYSFFGSFDKVILSFGMIAGRLELYTLMLLFTKSFWKRF